MDSNPSLMTRGIGRRIDQLGIGLAGLCVLHCLATLFAVWVAGVGGHFLLAPEFHRIGLALALVIAAAAIGWGVLRHGRILPIAVALIGIALMAAALTVPHGNIEIGLTVVGVALLSVGHALNMAASKR